MRGHALLFARDERNGALAHLRRHPVVDLPRQQTQRQPDHAGLVRKHTLDRAMGFARVGGTYLRRNTGSKRGRRKKHL